MYGKGRMRKKRNSVLDNFIYEEREKPTDFVKKGKNIEFLRLLFVLVWL